MLRGPYAYFAVPTNLPTVRALRHQVKVRWFLNLQQRSQRRLKWRRMNRIDEKYLPMPRVLHPWPDPTLPRQTPKLGAGCGNPARTDLCGGAVSNGRPYRERAPIRTAQPVLKCLST